MIFCSGSCRILRCLGDMKVEVLHEIDKYYGPKSLGYLHNTKQHIQFLKGDITLPPVILERFFNCYSPLHFPQYPH